jgi:RecB family exonuclease
MFRQQYVLGNRGRQSAAASFGTVVHFALQTYYLNARDLDLAKQTFDYYWNHPEGLGCAPEYYLPRTSWSNYRALGLDMLARYHENESWFDAEVIGLEVPFTLPIGDHELTGTIDMLRITHDKKGRQVLDVADFKTGKKPYFLRYNVQFTAYIWATLQDSFWESIPNGAEWQLRVFGLPRRGTWINLKDMEEIDAGEREDTDFHRLLKTVNALAESVGSSIFVPTLSGDACAYCDFWKECGLPDGNLASVQDVEANMAVGADKILEW